MNKKSIFSLLFVIVAIVMLFFYDAEEKREYLHRDGLVFGTMYSVTYSNPEAQDLSVQIGRALEGVNNSLSMFNAESTIAKVNNNEAVVLDSMFLTVWEKGQEVSRATEGAFDMTVAPLVDLWGFGLKNKSVVTVAQVDSIRQYVGYELAVLEDGAIRKAYAEMRIDAGAIAKGYACDVVADLLRNNGCENLLVDIGGEVVLQGVNQNGNPWRVGITRPTVDAKGAEKELQEIIESTQLCMATSGNYLQYYFVDGQRRSHTIDPRTGYPVQHGLLSATVVASSCMRADALATACMVLGEADALKMIEQTDDAACYLIVASGDSLQITVSNNWKY